MGPIASDFTAVQLKIRHRRLRWLHRHCHLDSTAVQILDALYGTRRQVGMDDTRDSEMDKLTVGVRVAGFFCWRGCLRAYRCVARAWAALKLWMGDGA